jgi:hypothetical protein
VADEEDEIVCADCSHATACSQYSRASELRILC